MAEVLDAAAIAELRALNEVLEQVLGAMPPPEAQTAEEQRAASRAGAVLPPPVYLPQARDVMVPGRAGDIRLRVIAPDTDATGIYVHLHGGGWVLGDCDLQDEALAELANATGLCVVSVGYRLAPEHPYPAGPDDCEDAVRWVLTNGPHRFEAPPVFTIGGESGGAHLAVVTLVRLRDRHGITGAFRAATLACGNYDLSMTPSQRRWGERRLVLSTPTIRWFVDQFTPGYDAEQRRDPDVSPLYADLHDLPPALMSVGALDPLLDDSLFLAARWRAAGNEVELVVYPEAPHAFNGFPTTAARVCNDAQHAYLGART